MKSFENFDLRTIEDYVTNIHQWVEVKHRIVAEDVPQGSFLGPKLSKVCANDPQENAKERKIYMFAEDTTAYCVGKIIEEVMNLMNALAKFNE